MGDHYRANHPVDASDGDDRDEIQEEGNVAMEPVVEDGGDDDGGQHTGGAFARLRDAGLI